MRLYPRLYGMNVYWIKVQQMRIWDWRHILYLCHVFPIFLHVYVRNCRFMHKMGQLLVQGGLNQVHCWNVNNIISHVNDGRPCREHCQLLASDCVVSHTYLGTFDVVMQVVSESVDQVDRIVLSLFTYVSWVENCKRETQIKLNCWQKNIITHNHH